MRFITSLVPGLLFLATTTSSLAQTAATPTAEPIASIDAPARKTLIKLGLNAARPFRHSNYYGLASRVPLSVGAEYLLCSNFTLYGQLDADLGVPSYQSYYERNAVVPTGAISLGARYYYNQAGRARHNRAHGAFIGNYLAVEAHSEMLTHSQGSAFSPTGEVTLSREYAPSLNLLWGMQRRLSRNFLFDLNAGIGLSTKRSDAHFGGYSSGALNLSSQLNLGIYFGR